MFPSIRLFTLGLQVLGQGTLGLVSKTRGPRLETRTGLPSPRIIRVDTGTVV